MSVTDEMADGLSELDSRPRGIDTEASPSAGWRRVYREMEVFIR